MNMNKSPWPIVTIFGWKEYIDTNPDYQRPAVWTTAQKQLLMDTIVRGYDIPKLYFRQICAKPEKYEVVDGQQRLRAIFDFVQGNFRLPKNSDPVEGCDVKDLSYSQLPSQIRIKFDVYPLDIIVINNAEEDEIKEMFLRLQNGTTLKAQEKRNAMPGKMRNFVRDLTGHKVFKESVTFSNSRYSHDHVAAQITLIELKGGLTNIKDRDLNKMYEENKGFDENGSVAKKIRRVLDYLYRIFPEKTPELERYSFISLYALVSYLLEKFDISNREQSIQDWFIAFEQYRKEQMQLPSDQADPEIIAYHEKISHSTDAYDSLQERHSYLCRKLFESITDIMQKDDQRIFTQEQRMAIYRRDKGYCQLKLLCNGEKCNWENWQADHIIPWSRGGKTTVDNGQVACPQCNREKSNKQMQ